MFSRSRPLFRFTARPMAPRRPTRGRFRLEALETRLALAAEPFAANDSVGTIIENAVEFDILGNDLPGDSGDPIDPTTIDILTLPTHGTVTVDPVTGIVHYTPDRFFTGIDTFTYQVRDTSTAGTAEEQFTIVEPSNGTTPGAIWKYLDDGSNQGTAWTASDFDDSTWQSGPSQLGYGDGDEETVLRCGPTAPTCNANNFITSYYRHKLQLSDLASITDMDVVFRYDDGLLSYVNGQNFIFTPGMTFGAAYDTFAPPRGTTQENDFVGVDLDPDDIARFFVEGENTFAVEIHQDSQASSDATFDWAVLIDRLVPAGRLSNTATVTINVANPQPLASSDSAQTPRGEPVSIDVLANDIPGYTNHPLNPASVQIVRPPAFGTTQVDPESGAVTYTPQPGYVGNDTFTYRVQDTATENGFIHTMLLPRGSVWKYLDTGPANPDPAWKSGAFDDSSWASGQAELGYGDDDEATVINCGPSAPTCDQGNFITSYFRRVIDVADPAAVDRLNILLKRDDGAVIYINGREVLRDRMPIGTILPTTLSTGSPDGEGFALHEISAAALAGVLIPGQNTVAVEIHQVGSTSSDVSFDLELIATDLFGPGHPSNAATVDVTVTPVTSTGCTQADLTGDGQITHADFGRLVRNYGAVSVAAGSNGDLDNNGRLGLNDLRLMQARMGEICSGGSPAAAPGAAVAEMAAPQPRRARISARALSAPAVDRAITSTADDSPETPREVASPTSDTAASTTRLRASRQSAAHRTNPTVGL